MIAQVDFGGVLTSRIGFGCGRLNGGVEARSGARLVEAMLKLGVRHFDVAPSYGMGLAEDVLGTALAGESVTVATKVGIARPPHPGMKGVARALLSPVLTYFPSVKARLVGKVVQSVSRGQFGLEQVEASFSESLRRLRRDRVDALLLHEASAGAITPELTAHLTGWQEAGRARLLGSGTGNPQGSLVPFGQISQYRWTGDASSGAAINVIHGILRHAPTAADWTPAQREDLAQLGRDQADPDTRTGLALTRALALTPGSIALVSSRSAARIEGLLRAVDWDLVVRPSEADLAAMERILTGSSPA
ncbi:MAG: aldo/keto reductase [Novosphingobium aromaticivorans]|jgi:aryl-alcohol dehydrogenase-like predicted oxidoreductase|nr:aldo/keto reductase [Novosphingobium aromaticivorans]